MKQIPWVGWIVICLAMVTQAVSKEAILKLNTEGHTGTIRSIMATSDHNQIVTASDDKTIRVWDAATGRELRKFGGHIGLGSEGQSYSLSLSPDDKYLAAGGWLSENSSGYGDVRIYDFHTGKLIKVLQSHTSVIFGLRFSKDGNYLVTASADDSVKIWDMKSFTLVGTISDHTNDVSEAALIRDGSSYLVASVSDDDIVMLHRFEPSSGRISKVATYNTGFDIDSIGYNGVHIAVSGDKNTILVFDHNLNMVKTIYNDFGPSGLEYSPNGRYLVSGSSIGTKSEEVIVYDSYKDYQEKKRFTKHTNSVFSVVFLDNNRVASAGGDHKEMYIWDINTGEDQTHIQGVGDVIWSVGIKGNKIAFGHKFSATDFHFKQSPFQKSFDLDRMQVTSDIIGFNRAVTTQGNLSLDYERGGPYNKVDAVLKIKRNGNSVASVTRTSSTGYSHRCFGFYKDYVISGGGNGSLRVYDLNGKEVANLVGHNGSVWSIAVDGDRLVSGSDDQTIKVWDLSQIGHATTLHPMVTLFVATNDEFIVWTEKGYYNASIGGDRYVGYHINQGRYKESRFVSSDKFFSSKYRPDIIKNILKVGSEEKAIAYADRTKKVEKVDVVTSLPPLVSLLSPASIKTERSSVDVTFEVRSDETPIKEIIVTLNGRKIQTRALMKKKNSPYYQKHTITVDIEDAKNVIQIMARNKYALSDSVTVTATKRVNEKDIFKPTLYLLAIGVSEYQNKSYNLGVADKDAKAIAGLFQNQKGKIYKDVQIKSYINEGATKDNILDGLDWLNAEATQRDVAIIFIAGHGVNDDHGKYYFLNHDANLDRLRRTALKWIEFEDTLNNLPSKVILLADTCHSGNITGTRRDMTSAIKSIVNAGTGQVIMTATTGNGYSYEEKSWGHGAFTKSLIEGLKEQKADYDEDGMVSIKEIDLYVTNRVKKLTKGKQKPTTIIPISIPDFALVHK